MRLETLGALAAFSAAVLAIEARGAASQMGLTLSYALQITSLTSMTVRLASVAENAFNAVERIAEYSKLTEEAPAVIPDSAPPGWPSAGKVTPLTTCSPPIHRLISSAIRYATWLALSAGQVTPRTTCSPPNLQCHSVHHLAGPLLER